MRRRVREEEGAADRAAGGYLSCTPIEHYRTLPLGEQVSLSRNGLTKIPVPAVSASLAACNHTGQVAFLHRHELARRNELLRNVDDAEKAMATASKPRHNITLVLDNLRSAENVRSIFEP